MCIYTGEICSAETQNSVYVLLGRMYTLVGHREDSVYGDVYTTSVEKCSMERADIRILLVHAEGPIYNLGG